MTYSDMVKVNVLKNKKKEQIKNLICLHFSEEKLAWLKRWHRKDKKVHG